MFVAAVSRIGATELRDRAAVPRRGIAIRLRFGECIVIPPLGGLFLDRLRLRAVQVEQPACAHYDRNRSDGWTESLLGVCCASRRVKWRLIFVTPSTFAAQTVSNVVYSLLFAMVGIATTLWYQQRKRSVLPFLSS